MRTNLKNLIPILQNYFDRVGSLYSVDKNGTHFDGLFVYCPSLIAMEGLERCKEIVGEDAERIYFDPNNEQIIIE